MDAVDYALELCEAVEDECLAACTAILKPGVKGRVEEARQTLPVVFATVSELRYALVSLKNSIGDTRINLLSREVFTEVWQEFPYLLNQELLSMSSTSNSHSVDGVTNADIEHMDKAVGTVETDVLPQSEKVNHIALALVLVFISRELAVIERCLMTGFVIDYRRKEWRRRDLIKMSVNEAILRRLVEFLPLAAKVPLTDYIFSRYERLPIERYVEVDDVAKYRKQLASFHEKLILMTCISVDSHDQDNSLVKHLVMFSGGIKYGVRFRHRSQTHALISVNANIRILKDLWNLPEEGVSRKAYGLTFPSIKFNIVYEIPGLHELDPPVSIRVLSNGYGSELLAKSSMTPDSFGKDVRKDVIVMHFHGGGFVGQTSFSHQSYTRYWSKKLNCVVISVDYRLAPEAQYPLALNDCHAAYIWVWENAEQVLGVKPETIILTGDSAGGNLACALTVRAIRDGFRVPDGLVVSYPALLLGKFFYPSLLKTLDDSMLPVGFLELCLDSYIPKDQDLSDPCLNPIFADEEVLKLFPRIRIQVGEQDPIRDQSLMFANKLHNLNVDVELTMYSELGHGFLSFDSPCIIPLFIVNS